MNDSERVTKKLVHWGIIACKRLREEMVSYEEERKLSFRKIKEIADKPCINCKMCGGQQTLDKWG